MDLEYQFARKILVLAKAIIANRNNNLKHMNLTAEQADALKFFSENQNASIRDLSNNFSITHQTASGIVKRLCEKEIVQLVTSAEDARRSQVILTSHGHGLIEQLKENGTHTGEKIFSGMNADEKSEFSRLLDKALTNILKQQK